MGDESAFDHEVLVIGGSAAGLAVGLFTNRHGLDTTILRGGRTTLLRCSILENYLGVPPVEPATFLELATEQTKAAGCTVINNRVERLEKHESGFAAELNSGETVTARRVVAATGSENDYLEPFVDGAYYRGPATHTNPNYHVPCDEAGRTDTEGFYAAGRLGGATHQALIAAGNGGRVGLSVVRDSLREEGFPEVFIESYFDWAVMEHRHNDWDIDEWFNERLPEAMDPNGEEATRLRERYRELMHARERTAEDRTEQRKRAQELLRDHVLGAGEPTL